VGAAAGHADPSHGHRSGAGHLDQLLGWCAGLGVDQVTVFVASIDNLRRRETREVDLLMELAERVSAEWLARPVHRWRVQVAGQLDVLPGSTARALKRVVEATRDTGPGQLTLAIGYDGRTEIVDALRGLLERAARAGTSPAELAERLTAGDIAAHLYTRGTPDPDLVIRTSGELRLGGFLLWQAAHSELYFCDVYWPGFRQVDFLRALRTYATRQRARPPGLVG
jgi:short-chain Z-isoprenyl diphosphate synthase